MRYSLLLLLTVFGQAAFAQDASSKDSSDAVQIKGRMLLANRGFAPIAAFSFDDPIAIGYLSIKKKRFRFEPDFALGLNGKPWMNNNWFRYNMVARKKWQWHIGINPFLFFNNTEFPSGKSMIHAQRSLVAETGLEYRLSGKWILRSTWQHNWGCDTGALSGNFVEMNAGFPDICMGRSMFIKWQSQIFYFDFTGNMNGLFNSNIISIGRRRIPVQLYVQAVFKIHTDFPADDFKWNTGIIYFF